ncbi:amylo-alpha-1,6-glucosidase, partial [Arthrobacter deserti]|nr:amylo-alpha-1,6-glucosidase [Arthrobacter deserti]
RLATCLFEAAGQFEGRLPELFCGFDRSEYENPVPYPTSCSPHASAAASPVHLMRTLQRMAPSLPTGELWMAPVLPDGFGSFEAGNVQLGRCRLFLSADRDELTVEGLGPAVTLHRNARSPRTEFLDARRPGPRHTSGTRDGN